MTSSSSKARTRRLLRRLLSSGSNQKIYGGKTWRRAAEARRLELYPHQITRTPPPQIRFIPGSGAVIARIYSVFEVRTDDWHLMKYKLTQKVAKWLENMPIQFLEIDQVVPLLVGETCTLNSLMCKDTKRDRWMLAPGIGGASKDGDLSNTDPRTCKVADTTKKNTDFNTDSLRGVASETFAPEWRNAEHLRLMVWDYPLHGFCVSQHNTSLMMFPTPMNNTYITGYRFNSDWPFRKTRGNFYLADHEQKKIYLELHIVGVIPIPWAKYFNAKFILNGTIPLPIYQPEFEDIFATHTDNLNLTLRIFGIRQKVDGIIKGALNYLPICVDPPVPAKGCFRMDHKLYDNEHFNEYAFKNLMWWKRHAITTGMSSADWPLGEWNLTQGPWPTFTWYGPRMTPEDPGVRYLGPWNQFTFPQKLYSLGSQSTCRAENTEDANCSQLPMAPMPRFLHTAVLYRTWEFEKHAKRYLCDNRPDCGADCLHNLSCLGGADYFQGNFYFRSSEFLKDDGGTIPPRYLDDVDCPYRCCADRRVCLRITDVLGYPVPFSSPMMLIFGGKAHEQYTDPSNGKLIFHSCETIPKAELRSEWRSCSEVTLNELWRYDIIGAKWEFMKTGSVNSPTTGKPVGWPVARFGHGAVIIEREDETSNENRQIYMYIFGGMGSQCTSGVCNDVWRYEIGWAAQAFYPIFPGQQATDWARGNLWDRLKDNSFGGRYRHGMVGTSSMEYIFVYGGQTLGGFDDTLLRYRVSTDLWEDMRPYGRVSLTRLMYDYQGVNISVAAPVTEYEEATDINCSIAWNARQNPHCKFCPKCGLVIGRRENGADMPTERSSFGVVSYMDTSDFNADQDEDNDAIAVFGGFRTTWGDPSKVKVPKECLATSRTTTFKPPEAVYTRDETGAITLTDPPTTTPVPIGPMTTTTLEGGVQVEGSFDTLGGDRNPQTSAGLITTTITTTPENLGPVTRTSTRTYTTGTQTTATTTTNTQTETSTQTTSPEAGASTGFVFTAPPTSTVAPLTTPPGVVVGAYITNVSDAVANQTEENLSSNIQREGPTASCSPSYYFNDLWKYQSVFNRWSKQSLWGNPPTPIKGHSLIARQPTSNDTMLVLFGGSNQDDSLNDMWILYVKRSGQERVWTKMDKFFPGLRPPTMAFHTMIYVEELDTAYLFGGLHWDSTRLEASDALRDKDRKCLKEAQGLVEDQRGSTEQEFLNNMELKCSSISQFCCVLTAERRSKGIPPPEYMNGIRIRTDTNAINLTAVSALCRADCNAKAFYPEFSPVVAEGIWSFNMSSCPGNCNGHGRCDFSQCVCETDWYGADCSQPRCPGSLCYADPNTKEQFCIECSGNGKCINGICRCNPGFDYDDCSVPICEGNCSSTPLHVKGVCVEDFPVHQCHCFGRYSGYNCSELLCINDCSGRGKCKPDGICECHPGFHGDDCSIFTIDFDDTPATG
eukprot:TRINITY_DN15952_c0_g1_i2.p1 TRINITY_DN15952_c0_g1~~TRINITY_DN15952_c0_g1_i2.p1  ORF type:complete len:1446 (-),score=169.12 TRINITY_DN15952_c0_g1_i2:94-4431(-)